MHACPHAPRALLLALLTIAACGDDRPRRIPDDFCHGERDGLACDDGDPCTADDRCGAGVCRGRAALDCSGLDEGCMVGACDPETVTCVAVAAPEGTSCSDDDACTTADACREGVCEGAAVVCPGQEDGCATSVCDPATGACGELTPAEDGTDCGLDACTPGACEDGACQLRPVDCSSLDAPCAEGTCDPATGACEAVPFAENAACDDDNPCTSGETCVRGACGGATQAADGTACSFEDDLCRAPGTCAAGVCDAETIACPPPRPCHEAVCDPAAGTCGERRLEDGTACDDRDACTAGETCTAGVCGGGESLCFCRGKDDGTPCDDGQRCTANDVCDDGACLGAPVNCSALDDGKCIVGSCDPQTGACVPVPEPVGTSCDDALSCTSLDRCVNGRCIGEARDCSDLDSGCAVGLCDEQAGGCVTTPRPDGTRCEDGTVCTAGDSCLGGTCGSGGDACAACEGKAVGTPCDDGDACTDDSICVLRGGARVCEGTPRDCSGSGDACHVGLCDPASGACVKAPRPGRPACEDGDACTVGDTCGRDGVCRGEPVLTCGAQIALCEPVGDYSELSQALQTPPVGASLTVLGEFREAAEVDWWAFPVTANQRVTIEARPHCGSEFDTVMGVYRADGSLVVEDDNSGAGDFSRVTDILTTRDETLYLGITAYTASGTGTYLLTVTTEAPPLCRTDADCPCGELKCVLRGENAGRCVPKMPEELEPNDAPVAANDIAIGGEVWGEVSEPGDVEWFSVDLVEGEPIAVRTRPYCEEGLETSVAIYADDAITELGFAAANGFAAHGDLQSFTPPWTGRYFIRVESSGSTVGRYVLTVASRLCTADAQCGCEELACAGDSAEPGLCVPARPSADDGATAIEVGARLHGAIERAWEVRRYTTSLAAGRYDVVSGSFCGSNGDTVVSVFGPDGKLVREDDDSGEGYFGAVKGLVVPAAGQYEIRVRSAGAGLGDFLLTLDFSAED
jgi:hypothetical protein